MIPDLDRQAETSAPLFGLVALPVGGGEYELRVEPLAVTGPERALMIEADRLANWLLSRGCEFCAHAVKLGRAVHCDHPPVTAADLVDLGFNLA